MWAVRLTIIGMALSLISVPVRSQSSVGATNTATAGSFKIAGTVVNAVTGTPLAQARVTIRDMKRGAEIATMVTLENGRFEFDRLAASKYWLRGDRRGFLIGAFEEHDRFSTGIVTGPEFQTENLVLRLTPMGIITGHIYDEAGDPVEYAQVVLFMTDNRLGLNRTSRVLPDPSTTDDLGTYEYSHLRPGTYYLSVAAKPWYAIHPPLGPDGQPSPMQHVSPALDVAYPTIYYGGTIDADAATPIVLKGGDHLEIDMHVSPVPALHLLLRAPQVQQGQIEKPVLEKHVFDSVEPMDTDEMRMVAPGIYELTGVPAGRYTIRRKNSNSEELEQVSEVELIHNGQELNSLHSEPVGTVRVTIKMAGQESLPKQMSVAVQDSRRQFVAMKRAEASGDVTFESLPPGKYSLAATTPTEAIYVARSVSQNGETQGHDLNITPGANLDVTAFVVGGVVKIEGVVHKGEKPLSGAMVMLVPREPQTHLELFRRDQSDFDGTFLLTGVIPTTYTILAIEDGWDLEWVKPGVIEPYLKRGQELTIGELMRGTVHLPEPVEVQPR
jgi:uncharacterized surface anchored protein